MRILVITDTHNELEIINQLATQTQADICIHCGDLGFYDQDSWKRLSKRELQLRIKHSNLPKSIRKGAYGLDIEEARDIISTYDLLGGLVPYLEAKKKFILPVYAVWGNHEDIEFVSQLRNKQVEIENLFLLDEHQSYAFNSPRLRLRGIGGNFYLDGPELFAPDISGSGGQIRSSWLAYSTLLAKAKAKDPDIIDIFVSHVSPGKSEARILERLCLLMGIDLCLSGHMGPPLCHAYSLFAICEPEEALARSQSAFDKLLQRWLDERDNSAISFEQREVIDRALEKLDLPPLPPSERGQRAKPFSFEHYYYNTQFLNLPDTPDAWSIIEINDRQIDIQNHAKFSIYGTK
jgi:predicted phosphodiesterase